MNRRKIALGPGAASLILIVVVLSLCMLAMLTQISARNDDNLCRRSAEMTRRVYEVYARSEQRLAELDAVLLSAQKDADGMETYLEKVGKNLPEGMSMEEGDRVTWTEPLDSRHLQCTVQLLPPGEKQRTKRISHQLIADEPEDDWE